MGDRSGLYKSKRNRLGKCLVRIKDTIGVSITMHNEVNQLKMKDLLKHVVGIVAVVMAAVFVVVTVVVVVVVVH